MKDCSIDPVKRICLRFFFFLIVGHTAVSTAAQVTQWESRVVDESGKGIAGALVVLHDADSTKFSTMSLEDGRFMLFDFTPGVCTLQVSKTDFHPVARQLTLNRGKNEFLNIQLTLSATLPTVEIQYVNAHPHSPGGIRLDRSTFNILPASFDDPSRLYLKSPAITTTNDQANGVIYRGLPSHFHVWKLDGLEIVNPNHLSNAGTISDRLSPSAGGVNSLAGQTILMANFSNALAASMPNSLGSVTDIVSAPYRSYAQASLLGFEGGVGNEEISVGYRYSFTGLLNAFGVDFGGEAISYQDANFRLQKAIKGKKIKLAANYGTSSNVFMASESPTTLKEFQDIRYDSGVLLTSASLEGKWVDFRLAYSSRRDKRMASGTIDTSEQSTLSLKQDDKFTEYLAVSQIDFKIVPWLKAGVYSRINVTDIFRYNRLNSKTFSLRDMNYGSLTHSLYTDFDWNTELYQLKLRAQPSLAYIDVGYRSIDFSPDINLEYRRFISPKHEVYLYAGHQSQNPWRAYLRNDGFRDVRLMKTMGLNIGYRLKSPMLPKFELQGFYQHFYDLPVSDQQFNSFNEVELPFEDEIGGADGKGRNYGLSLELSNTFKYGLYFNANAALFRSEYLSQETWVETSQNTGFTSNLSVGKVLPNATKDKFWRFGLSGHFALSRNMFPLQYAWNPTVITRDYAMPMPLPENYWRIDLRITRQTKHGNLSLDIQNVTGRRNLAYTYFNPVTNQMEDSRQLGLIPNLSYRYNW